MLYCGCAACDITTRDDGVKINDPLFAKVFAFDTGTDRFAVISMDCIAIGDIGEVKDSFLPRLRSEIHNRLGINERYVMVSATHTHIPGKMICDEDTLVKLVYGAVAEAFSRLEPVKLGVGYGYDDSFIINRTLKLKDGSYWSVRQAHPLPSDRDFDSLDYADARIPIVRIDRADGSLMGVIFNFGC
nr:hypothetical protein [Clostridia bacterium]